MGKRTYPDSRSRLGLITKSLLARMSFMQRARERDLFLPSLFLLVWLLCGRLGRNDDKDKDDDNADECSASQS